MGSNFKTFWEKFEKKILLQSSCFKSDVGCDMSELKHEDWNKQVSLETWRLKQKKYFIEKFEILRNALK